MSSFIMVKQQPETTWLSEKVIFPLCLGKLSSILDWRQIFRNKISRKQNLSDDTDWGWKQQMSWCKEICEQMRNKVIDICQWGKDYKAISKWLEQNYPLWQPLLIASITPRPHRQLQEVI